MSDAELRELDAQIARRLFIYSLVTCEVAAKRAGCITLSTGAEIGIGGVLHYGAEYFADDAGFITQYPDDPIHGRLYQIPYYSSDMAAAMEVVERLTGGSRYVEMSNRDGQWEVVFWDYAESLGSVVCKSLPEAICRAALKAVAVAAPPLTQETEQ